MSDPVLCGRHIAELNATNNALVGSYVCYVNGTHVQLHEFPGVLTRYRSEQFGVLHCLAEYYTREMGADTGCIAAANLLFELEEFVELWEWWPTKSGPIGWFLDTYSDMVGAFTGAQLTLPEECVPAECKRREGN